MTLLIVVLLLSLPFSTQTASAVQEVSLMPNVAIGKSVRVASRVYRLPNKSEDLNSAALYVKGNNITVDFQGTVLEGTPQSVEPDKRKGTGILVTGKNITIKNLKIRGYKIGIVALNCPGLR